MIYGGVVLLGEMVVTCEELVTLSIAELDRKYHWVLEAPNVQHMEDKFTGDVRIRSRVPSITTVGGPR